MEVPKDLTYVREHVLMVIGGQTAVVGSMELGQEQLWDIVFVELPEAGSEVEQ